MSKLWKKAAFPTIEEIAREISIKKRLTVELGRAIQQLQLESVDKGCVVYGGEHISNICSALEAAFIHGLKGNFSFKKVSSVFRSSSVDAPEPNFWPLIVAYSHKDVLSRILNMGEIVSDVGRCRAWLRAALNEGIICSYLDTLINDKTSLQRFYNAVAYMRDREEPDIMRQLLGGLSVFTFQLPCDGSLNSWNSAPLILAGVWSPPPNAPEPVMPAVDVMEFFTEKEPGVEEIIPEEIVTPNLPVEESLPNLPELSEVVERSEISTEKVESDVQNVEPDNETNTETSSYFSIPEQVAHLSSTPTKHEEVGIGNKISVESGWSSEFEELNVSSAISYETAVLNQSYDSLLQSYNKNVGVLVGTPDISEHMMSNAENMEEPKSDYETVSNDSRSPILDYEVIPRTLSSGSSDDRTKNLLAVIGEICPEQGLDKQKYQCQGCGCPVGMIYGKAYLCHYDGYSYCSDCHANEEYYIPARIIHNWDFKKYPVSNYTKVFLTSVESEPLIDMKTINPLIYSAIEEMDQLRLLRTQLNFLRSYIFTCKESIAEELRRKIWPREYLYEHVHLYSITDLLLAPSGSLQASLIKMIDFAKKHVLNCQLCSLKGFICEICNAPKVIYPFDMESTFHCDLCRAVYHANCKSEKKFCPKCERKRRREEIQQNMDN